MGSASVRGASSWLSQRRAILVLLSVTTAISWIGCLYYLLSTSAVLSNAWPAFFGVAPVMSVLLALYWRGWQRARYLVVVLVTLVVGAFVPIPTEHATQLSAAVLIPSVMALVLAGARWVAGSALGTLGILLLRAGGMNHELRLTTLMAYVLMITCLVVSRLVLDAARREAEARAEQAERAQLAAEEARAAAEHAHTASEAQAAALQRQQSSLHFQATLLAAVEQPVLATNEDGIVTYWNDAAERLFGWSATEIVGKHFADLEPPLYQLPAEPSFWAERLGQPSTTNEHLATLRDGTEIPTSVTSWPIPDVDDTLLGRIAVITDLTARKEAERQRERFEQGDRLRVLGQMASGIAHDLNQALAVVSGYVDLARDSLHASVDLDELRTNLNTASQAAAQGADSVKRLLTFARHHDLGPPELVDVGQVLDETIRFTAPQWRDRTQAEGRPVTVGLVAESGLFVMGWATSLREALMNLLLNAIDAMPQGGSIRLSARREGENVLVEVADTGTGMSPEVQSRIFEPFYTTKGEQGTGLGLAMVLEIVGRHSGHVNVVSAPGEGTCFCLRLPSAAAPAVTMLEDEDTEAVRAARILLVDDEPRLLMLLTAILRRDQHQVETAASGEAALALLKSDRYQLVISDLSLGTGMNGWQLADCVAEQWPGTNFVLASGWGAGISEQEARAHRVDAVLAKPYRLDEVRSVVSRLTG